MPAQLLQPKGHEKLDRDLILPTLRQLENAKTTHISPPNHQQKFEELSKTCDSDLERTVLKRIAEEGLPLPNEAQHIIYDKDVRIAKPDF